MKNKTSTATGPVGGAKETMNRKKYYLVLINANNQLQTEGYNVPDLWCIFHAGNTPESALRNALSRRQFMRPEQFTVVEDTPENRSKYGNPLPV